MNREPIEYAGDKIADLNMATGLGWGCHHDVLYANLLCNVPGPALYITLERVLEGPGETSWAPGLCLLIIAGHRRLAIRDQDHVSAVLRAMSVLEVSCRPRSGAQR